MLGLLAGRMNGSREGRKRHRLEGGAGLGLLSKLLGVLLLGHFYLPWRISDGIDL